MTGNGAADSGARDSEVAIDMMGWYPTAGRHGRHRNGRDGGRLGRA